MEKYKFKYWYEWGAGDDCLWAANDAARDKYGYNPMIDEMPLSKDLVNFLNQTGSLHDNALNWEYPPDPPDPKQWTPEMEADFDRWAHDGYDRLCAELGEEFEIEYAV